MVQMSGERSRRELFAELRERYRQRRNLLQKPDRLKCLRQKLIAKSYFLTAGKTTLPFSITTSRKKSMLCECGIWPNG